MANLPSRRHKLVFMIVYFLRRMFDRSRTWGRNHFPIYFDGLRIRSSRSASNPFRTVRRRLCLAAIATDWGSNQACLISWMIVMQMSFSVFIGGSTVLSQLSTNRSNLVKIRTGHGFAIRESCFGVKRLEFLLCLNSSWQRGHASAYAKLPSLTPQRGHLLSNIHCLRIFHFCLRFGFSSWRKARAKRPGPALRPSGDVDLDLLGFGFRVLGQVYCQHAVFELGANLPWAGIIRKREAAPETTVGAFDAVILSAFLLLLESAFAHDRQRAFLRRDLHILFPHFRQLRLDQILFVIFADVRQRRPFGYRHGFLLALWPLSRGAVQQAAQTPSQRFQFF